MAKRQTKAEKQLDKEIERLYYLHGNRVEINIMSISKIYAECRAASVAGGSLEEAMLAAIAKYRLN